MWPKSCVMLVVSCKSIIDNRSLMCMQLACVIVSNHGSHLASMCFSFIVAYSGKRVFQLFAVFQYRLYLILQLTNDSK